jgi:hypothetical protein
MSTRHPWKFRTAPTPAILDQPDVVRQESWHTSAFRLESRLSTSSSGSSMGPSGEGLAIGGALTGRPDQLWALVVGVDNGRRQAGLDGCRTKCSFSSATPVGRESRAQVGNRHLRLG